MIAAHMGNPFVHLDLTTGDVAAAKKFYGAIFDWQFEDFPAMNWTGIRVGDGVGGGLGVVMFQLLAQYGLVQGV